MEKTGIFAKITQKITTISGIIDFAGAAICAATAVALTVIGGLGFLAIGSVVLAGLYTATGIAKQRVSADAKTTQMVQDGLIQPEQAKWKSGPVSRALVRCSSLVGIAAVVTSLVSPLGALAAMFSGVTGGIAGGATVVAGGADLVSAHNAAKQKDIKEDSKGNPQFKAAKEQAGDMAGSIPSGIKPLPADFEADRNMPQKDMQSDRGR